MHSRTPAKVTMIADRERNLFSLNEVNAFHVATNHKPGKKKGQKVVLAPFLPFLLSL